MEYLITGCGYLTKYLIKDLLKNKKITRIKIFSRNEKSQWQMKNLFNNNRLDFIIGDIRDEEALNKALKNTDYCIHAAAIKRIEVAENQPIEAIKTNVFGSMNVINACIKNKVKKLILISTDKATFATTCYGSTKFLMECMANANKSNTDIICIRYGNVFGSTGSVVPIFDKLAKQNQPLTVRNPNMTRFFMEIDKCVEIILNAIEKGINKELWVYESKSCTIKDLADAFSKNQIIIGTENIEKNNEALISVEELNNSIRYKDYYIIRKGYESEKEYTESLTSYNAKRLSQKEIKKMIENWRKNEDIGFKL